MPVVQLVDRMGTMKIREILDPIWHTKPATAMRLRGRIEKILDWAKANHYRDGENVARWKGHLDAIYPAKEKIAPTEHQPAMPYRDVPAFMTKLRAREGVDARALEFIILTGARISEALEAEWSEIDKKARLWIVPPEHMKMRKEHRQPLSDRALAILDKLPRHGDHIFERKGKPLNEKAVRRLLKTMGANGATVHGFRSSLRDWGSEIGDYPNELLELVIAHKVSDKTEAAYRRGSMLEKRRKLMADWSKFLSKTQGKVNREGH
jgi:integrase